MMYLKFHGCRGGSAFDSKENGVYGGNSSCYSIRCNQGLIILDAGTGFLSLDETLCFPENIYLMLSHYHHDHIEGLGISSILYDRARKLKVYGRNPREGLEARFNGINFPVLLSAMRGIESYNEIRPEFCLGDIKVETFLGNHPFNGSVGYKFSIEDKNIVYATDMEFSYDLNGKALKPELKENYKKFIRNAHILIADAQFTYGEYLLEKSFPVKGWGHSYPEEIIDMAAESGVRRVFLTHHAPKRNDFEMRVMEINAQDYCIKKGYGLALDFAKDGDSICLLK